MDTQEALKIAAKHFNWSEDISTEVSTSIYRSLSAMTKKATESNYLPSAINAIDPTILDRYNFQPRWELAGSELISSRYVLSLPGYEDTLAFLEIGRVTSKLELCLEVYDDSGHRKHSSWMGELSIKKIDSTIACWVKDLQNAAYYRQNTHACLGEIDRILTANGYPVQWIEVNNTPLELEFYEWTAPGIGSLYTYKRGMPVSYPCPAIEVITFDRRTYYLPVSATCRKHVVSSIDELRQVSESLVDRFSRSIDGFVELNVESIFPILDTAIFKVDRQFNFNYGFYCPIPEIAAIVCQHYDV